jgi:hypothetical protein
MQKNLSAIFRTFVSILSVMSVLAECSAHDKELAGAGKDLAGVSLAGAKLT